MSAFPRQSWMWTEACALLAEAERRQQQFMALLGPQRAGPPVWEPPADVLAADGEVHVVVALPGASSDQVVLRIGDGHVDVEAHVPPPGLGAQMQVLRLEIPYGVMRRRIALPPGRYGVAEKRLTAGCLTLRLLEIEP